MESSTSQRHKSISVINLSGELSPESLQTFKEAVADQFSKGAKTVIVDCRELGSIASSGLAALLWARSRASGIGRKIYFTHISTMVSEVLEITTLAGILRIEPTTRGLLTKLGMIRKPMARRPQRTSLASKVVRK